MPVGTIHSAKEQALAFQPLLLATFTFTDGTVLRLSTHGLRTADGGFQYGGNDYLPRILNQDIAAVQALSDGGVDVAPQVTLALNDGDQHLWTNYEKPKGFKGAKLALTFVFWNAGADDFSSDSVTKFLGICSAPQMDETQLTVTATSLLNMQAVTLPPVRVQKRCPWVFPTTKAQRVAGALDEDSWFWECGYSPDVTDADAPGGTAAARGNLNAGVPFTSCNYSKEQCQARGMYAKDSLVRITGRFGGVQWDPPRSWRGRAYASGKFEEGLNSPNEVKYNDPVPMVYGEGWVEPVIANIVGDPNSTRFEAICCYGEGYISRVIVNDVEVPSSTFATDPLFMWDVVARGTRDGAANLLPGWTDKNGDPTGDPYGSLMTIAIVVYRQLVDSQQIPRVRVLMTGPKLRIYTSDAGAHADEWPEHSLYPAWQIMDALVWAGWDYADLDIPSFRKAAQICGQLVTYKDQHGNSKQHARFLASFVLRQRKTAAELIRAMRNCGRMMLVPNSDAGGKLKLLVKQTLAGQQPAAVAGSNDATPLGSKLADGTAANGYVAYRFDESNIIRRGGRSTMRVSQRANSDSPNRISVTYQDRQNNFAQDSLTVVETDALTRNSNQEVAGSFAPDGISSFDHGRRLIGTYFAETLRGNPRNYPAGDAGGTLIFEFESTFRAVHLQAGALCALSYAPLGVADQLVRIQRIQPAANFETCKITASWHSDEWYTDAWGQEDAPRYSQQGRNREARPPWPLLGQVGQRALSNPDPLTGFERWFTVGTGDTGDGLRFRVEVTMPHNTFSADIQPPFVPNEGSTAPTGGSLPGDATYWVWLVALGPALVSVPSIACKITVPAGTNTNTITVPNIEWHPAAELCALHVGTHPFQPLFQGFINAIPSSVTFTGPVDPKLAVLCMPDPEFDRMEFRLKRLVRAGVADVTPTAATATTITVDGAGWTVDEWAGYDVSELGHDHGGYDWPRGWAWRVASNTADTLTLDAAYGPTANSILTFDPGQKYRLTFRAKPSAWTSSSITLPKLAAAVDEFAGKLVRVFAGTGRGQVCTIRSNTFETLTIDTKWTVLPDATTRVLIEDADWALVHRTESIDVGGGPATVSIPVPLEGLARRPLLCMVAPVDGGGNACFDQFNQVRDFWLYYETAGAANAQSGVHLHVEGTLAIGSDLAPRFHLNADTQAVAVTAEVKQAPLGAPLTVEIRQGAALWLSVTIPAGQTVVATNAAGAASLLAGENLSIDLTAVGTTFPGADLSVTIYL